MDRLLVRRTDFAESREPVTIAVGARRVAVDPAPGTCRVLSLR